MVFFLLFGLQYIDPMTIFCMELEFFVFFGVIIAQTASTPQEIAITVCVILSTSYLVAIIAGLPPGPCL